MLCPSWLQIALPRVPSEQAQEIVARAWQAETLGSSVVGWSLQPASTAVSPMNLLHPTIAFLIWPRA
jgi:hypothetical protein